MTLTSGFFLPPPTEVVARYPVAPLIGFGVLAVVTVFVGIRYTRRTRSPLFVWSAVAGLTLYPLVVEPLADYMVAVWYPTNSPIVAEVWGRPMPWLAILFYGTGIPLITVLTWSMVRRGLPARRLWAMLGALTLFEVPFEMVASHFNWMHYYGNHAVVLGVPIYCFAQNGGMFAVVAWVLGWSMPHMRGWRWVLMPFALAATLPVFAILTTFPAYLAIAAGAGPVIGWATGILSTILNAAVVVACVHSPTLRRYRDRPDARAYPPRPAPRTGLDAVAGAQ